MHITFRFAPTCRECNAWHQLMSVDDALLCNPNRSARGVVIPKLGAQSRWEMVSLGGGGSCGRRRGNAERIFLSRAARSAAEDLRVLLSVSRALNWVKVAIWKIESGVRRQLPVAGSEAAAAWERLGNPPLFLAVAACETDSAHKTLVAWMNVCVVCAAVCHGRVRERWLCWRRCAHPHETKDMGNCVSSFCGSRLQASNWFAHEIWGDTINIQSLSSFIRFCPRVRVELLFSLITSEWFFISR